MILIIDDMSIVRDPIAACLKMGGYETICAGSGRLVFEASQAIGLPDNIREPIENFHNGKTEREKVGPLPGILRMTDRYANGLLLTAERESHVEVFERAYVRSLLGSKDFVAPDPKSFSSQVRSLTVTLARLGRDEEALLLVPLYPRSAKRVWLARDPLLSDCDPLYCALAQMADVKLYPRLPTKEECSACDYLAVVSRNPTIKGFTEDAIAQSAAANDTPSLKVLWMVSDLHETQEMRTLRPVQMPMQLDKLAAFIAA